MANEKWSSFTDVGAPVDGDTLVGLHDGENVQFDASLIGGVTPAQIQSAAFISGTDSGIADAYVVTLDPSASFTEGNGTVVSFTPNYANATTSPTLAVNGNPGLPIYLPNNTPVSPNDMQPSNVATYCSYSNGIWMLMNPIVSYVSAAQIMAGNYFFYNNTGSADAYVLTSNVTSSAAPSAGSIIIFNGQPNLTTTPTATINGSGSYTITLSDGSPVQAGDINDNIGWAVCYLFTQVPSLVLLNPLISGVSDPYVNSVVLGEQFFAGATVNFTAPSELFLDLSSVITVNGNAGSNVSATNINFENFSSITGAFGGACDSLTSLNCPVLSTIGGALNVSASSASSYLFPELTTVGGNLVAAIASCTTVNLSALQTVGGDLIFPNGLLTDLNLAALTSVANDISIDITTLLTCELTSLSTVGGGIGNPSTGVFSFPATLFSLPAITTIGSVVNFTGMTSLTTFSFGSGLLSIGGNVTMSGLALNLASVDGVLASLAALDGTGGTTSYDNMTIDLSGGTNAAPDSAGLASIAILTGRGNTVNHN